MIEIDEITLAYLQINNIEHMACDFPVFHKAVEKVLGREVWTHQFMRKSALEEKRMYFKHREDIHTNLCYEDIKERINKKFDELCKIKQNESTITRTRKCN